MQLEASRALDRIAILSQTHYADAVQDCVDILRNTGLSIRGTRSAQYREPHDMRSAETAEQGKNRMRHARILAGNRFVESEPVALQISPHIATSHRALSDAIKTRCLHLAAAVAPGGSGSKSRRTNHHEP